MLHCVGPHVYLDVSVSRLAHVVSCGRSDTVCDQQDITANSRHLKFRMIFLELLLLTAIRFSPGGSGYFTCIQNMKLVTNKFKSGGLNEKHVVATWNFGNHLSICL